MKRSSASSRLSCSVLPRQALRRALNWSSVVQAQCLLAGQCRQRLGAVCQEFGDVTLRGSHS